IKPMENEVLLGIINEHHHWKLAVIYSHEKRSLVLDPLGGVKTRHKTMFGNNKV
uniref:Si:dkey-146m20.13 n=1 Tax=Fundulus heteroclitus TaxID=8078 RepID=A0A3Q2QTA1_FUNHE